MAHVLQRPNLSNPFILGFEKDPISNRVHKSSLWYKSIINCSCLWFWHISIQIYIYHAMEVPLLPREETEMNLSKQNSHLWWKVDSLNFLDNGLTKEKQYIFQSPQLTQNKLMVTVWPNTANCSESWQNNLCRNVLFLNWYCAQKLANIKPSLVNWRGPILLHENAWSHISRMTSWKLS